MPVLQEFGRTCVGNLSDATIFKREIRYLRPIFPGDGGGCGG